MYYITLTTQCELSDDEFQEIYGILDNSFDVLSVLTFAEDGSKIETVATMTTKESSFEYEYDVANKLCVDEGNTIVSSIAKLLQCDFELDAPIIKEEGCYED